MLCSLKSCLHCCASDFMLFLSSQIPADDFILSLLLRLHGVPVPSAQTLRDCASPRTLASSSNNAKLVHPTTTTPGDAASVGFDADSELFTENPPQRTPYRDRRLTLSDSHKELVENPHTDIVSDRDSASELGSVLGTTPAMSLPSSKTPADSISSPADYMTVRFDCNRTPIIDQLITSFIIYLLPISPHSDYYGRPRQVAAVTGGATLFTRTAWRNAWTTCQSCARTL